MMVLTVENFVNFVLSLHIILIQIIILYKYVLCTKITAPNNYIY